MSHRYNNDRAFVNSVNERVRKAPRQDVFAGAVVTIGIAQRSFGDTRERSVNFVRECDCSERAALTIEDSRLLEIDSRPRVKLHPHSSAKSSARTSSQSSSSTFPSSISRTRLSISLDQAALTSGVGFGSRLSIMTPASVARSDSGSSAASRMSSFRSLPMMGFHSTRRRLEAAAPTS